MSHVLHSTQLHSPVTGCSWSASTLLIVLHFILNCISLIVSTVFLRRGVNCISLILLTVLDDNCLGSLAAPHRAPICPSCAPNWQAGLPTRSLLRVKLGSKYVQPLFFSFYEHQYQQLLHWMADQEVEKVIFVEKFQIERKNSFLASQPSYHPRHPARLSRRLKRALANVPIISVAAPLCTVHAQ